MGSQFPPKRGTAPRPVFGPSLLWPNGWMDEDAIWYESRPRPRPHCVRRDPAPPARKGHSSPPLFGPCLLWPRSSISATAELLSCWLSKQRFDMVPILLLYHALKATTPFVDAFVNERLRQLLPSSNDCLLQFSDRRKASMFVDQVPPPQMA